MTKIGTLNLDFEHIEALAPHVAFEQQKLLECVKNF